MQGKGIIKFFLVVMTLVTILQYLYIIPTRKIERAADEYAKEAVQDLEDGPVKRAQENDKRAAYLDSLSNEVVWSIPLLKDFTYQELKSRQLAFGLDLEGGMSVVLQVDLREFIRTLANDSKDPTFVNALEKASQNQKSAQSDYVTLFADAWNEISGGKQLLNPIFSSNPSLRDEINSSTTNSEVIRILRTKAIETVDLTFKRLKDRIDELGVMQPNVSLDAARDLIVVELPGISNPERARNFLQSTAKLEFWNIYRITDPGVLQNVIAADQKLKAIMGSGESEVSIDTSYSYDYDTLGNIVDSTLVTNEGTPEEGPLFKLLTPNGATANNQLSMPRSVIGVAERNKMPAITAMLERPEIQALFPKDLSFKWAQMPTKDFETKKLTNEYELYAIRKQKGKMSAPLEGDRITDASASPDPSSGKVEVSLKMDSEGARIWGQMTTKAAQDNNREIAIVLDERVVSAPSVQNAILNGNSAITGDYSLQDANDLAKILQIGKLPAKTKIIQESLVGPSLGQKNIDSSINSLLIGFGLVFLFMIFYYGGSGIVAIVALFMNMFFIFGSLASYGTVLTLPGIAGIILTIGMAVDANVIIFERVREELREGKSLLASISDGFKHSYSAIIDANVTTILTAFVLAYFGLGPIKGFAVVLIIGVLSSIFTAVLLGRLMIEWYTSKGKNLTFWTGPTKNAFASLKVDWLGKRKIAYVISGMIILAGIGAMFARGFELGVDFKGGYSYNIEFEQGQAVNIDDVRSALDVAYEKEPFIVKAVSTDNTINVTTSYLINDEADDATDRAIEKLFEGINTVAGGSLSLDNFKDPDGTGTHITSSSKVGPTIADDIKTSSIYAAVFALLLIFLYIFIRFSKWQYSMGAVAALFHDTLIVLGIFALFHGILPFSLEIDQPFIAAILTVIGYSINDTVVVFDRIREYLANNLHKSKEEVINMAINSTLSRTVITSLTTLFVVSILLFFGGDSIRGFAFALFVGIIVGTYSSIFVATPIMSDLTGDIQPKAKTKKSFSKAATAK